MKIVPPISVEEFLERYTFFEKNGPSYLYWKDRFDNFTKKRFYEHYLDVLKIGIKPKTIKNGRKFYT